MGSGPSPLHHHPSPQPDTSSCILTTAAGRVQAHPPARLASPTTINACKQEARASAWGSQGPSSSRDLFLLQMMLAALVAGAEPPDHEARGARDACAEAGPVWRPVHVPGPGLPRRVGCPFPQGPTSLLGMRRGSLPGSSRLPRPFKSTPAKAFCCYYHPAPLAGPVFVFPNGKVSFTFLF